MADASDIALQIVASETDAAVAATAAQTAIVAADAAVTLAQGQTAIIAAEAAAKIGDAAQDVASMKEKLSWLENELTQTRTAMEAANLATMGLLSALEATVATLVLKSVASESPTPLLSGTLETVNPQNAVVDDLREAPEPSESKSKQRLKRL